MCTNQMSASSYRASIQRTLEKNLYFSVVQILDSGLTGQYINQGLYKYAHKTNGHILKQFFSPLPVYRALVQFWFAVFSLVNCQVKK